MTERPQESAFNAVTLNAGLLILALCIVGAGAFYSVILRKFGAVLFGAVLGGAFVHWLKI
jgi:hypothetical protein